MGLYEQVDYDFSGPLQPQDLFGREYVTMGGVIDHHLTTTVQSPLKMPKKPVVTTNNGLFLVSGSTVQNQQILRFNVCLYRPVVVLRLQRPLVRIQSGALKNLIAMYFCNEVSHQQKLVFAAVPAVYGHHALQFPAVYPHDPRQGAAGADGLSHWRDCPSGGV